MTVPTLRAIAVLKRRYREACRRVARPPLGDKARALKAVRARLWELMLAENARVREAGR